jgi:hypothetical protein
MRKHNRKMLHLDMQTVRSLSSTQLADARGGAMKSSGCLATDVDAYPTTRTNDC